MEQKLIKLVREIYSTNEFVSLHTPIFKGNEKKYLNETIDSTFVSSVGKFVDQFEEQIQSYCHIPRAVAIVNGTAALHTALYLSGVRAGDLVLTQALTFVATCNAIFHLGAKPVFIDIEHTSFGLCPEAVTIWLEENAVLDISGQCTHKQSGAKIRALLPMHTFGHPAQLDELAEIALKWNLTLIEDAAESLGSLYKGYHTGTIGRFGALSFNGNKIITTGGGGMLLCKHSEDGRHAKHVTTTAKRAHPYEFYHDEPGFNYRMPNLNAALGCAQLEKIDQLLTSKRKIAGCYQEFFAASEYRFIREPDYAKSNYWLNAVYCPSAEARNQLLEITNREGVMTRPVWHLMHRLPMFAGSQRGDLTQSELAEARLVNLPSSAVLE